MSFTPTTVKTGLRNAPSDQANAQYPLKSFSWSDGSYCIIWTDTSNGVHLTEFNTAGQLVSDQTLFVGQQGEFIAQQHAFNGDIIIVGRESEQNSSGQWFLINYCHLQKNNGFGWSVVANKELNLTMTNMGLKSMAVGWAGGANGTPLTAMIVIEYFVGSWNGSSVVLSNNYNNYMWFSTNDFASYTGGNVGRGNANVNTGNWNGVWEMGNWTDGTGSFLYCSKYFGWTAYNPNLGWWQFTPPEDPTATFPFDVYGSLFAPSSPEIIYGFQSGSSPYNGHLVVSKFVGGTGWINPTVIDSSGNAADPYLCWDGLYLWMFYTLPDGGGKYLYVQQLDSNLNKIGSAIQIYGDSDTNRYVVGQQFGNNQIQMYYLDTTSFVIKQILGTCNLAPYAPTNIQLTAGIHGSNGLAVASLTPALTWQFTDPNAGDTQSAYEYKIYASNGTTLIYDSTKVVSAIQGATVPSGASLAWNTSYFIEVSTYDEFGVQSPYSNMLAFKTSQPPTATLVTPLATQIAAPTLGASSTGGSLGSGTVYVQYTTVENGIETEGSVEASVAVTGPTGQVTVTLPTPASGQSYNIYAASSSGAEQYVGNTTATSYAINTLPVGQTAVPLTDIGYVQSPTVQWTYAQTGSQAQIGYEVIVNQSGTTVYDSGMLSGNANQLTLPQNLLQNSVQYTVIVYVVSQDGIESVLTSVSQANFNEIYAGPPTPSIVVAQSSGQNVGGTLTVSVTNPIAVGAQQPTQSNTIHRVDSSGNDIVLATSLAPNCVFTDYSCGNNQSYSYYAVAYASNGISTPSAKQSGTVVFVYPNNFYLVPMGNPTAQVGLLVSADNLPSYKSAGKQTIYEPIGAEMPLGIKMANYENFSGQVTALVLLKYGGYTSTKALRNTLKGNSLFWLKDYWGDVTVMMISDVTDIKVIKRKGFEVTFSFTEVQA